MFAHKIHKVPPIPEEAEGLELEYDNHSDIIDRQSFRQAKGALSQSQNTAHPHSRCHARYLRSTRKQLKSLSQEWLTQLASEIDLHTFDEHFDEAERPFALATYDALKHDFPELHVLKITKHAIDIQAPLQCLMYNGFCFVFDRNQTLQRLHSILQVRPSAPHTKTTKLFANYSQWEQDKSTKQRRRQKLLRKIESTSLPHPLSAKVSKDADAVYQTVIELLQQWNPASF